MSSTTNNTTTDDKLSDAELLQKLIQEAMANAQKVRQMGMAAYLQDPLPQEEEPKQRSTQPNKQFLKNIVKNTVGFNRYKQDIKTPEGRLAREHRRRALLGENPSPPKSPPPEEKHRKKRRRSYSSSSSSSDSDDNEERRRRKKRRKSL